MACCYRCATSTSASSSTRASKGLVPGSTMHDRHLNDRGPISRQAGLDLTLKRVDVLDPDAAAPEALGNQIQSRRPKVAVEGPAVALLVAGHGYTPTLVVGDHGHEGESLPRRALQFRDREGEGAITGEQDHRSSTRTTVSSVRTRASTSTTSRPEIPGGSLSALTRQRSRKSSRRRIASASHSAAPPRRISPPARCAHRSCACRHGGRPGRRDPVHGH